VLRIGVGLSAVGYRASRGGQLSDVVIAGTAGLLKSSRE
jgi:hypothetical protein